MTTLDQLLAKTHDLQYPSSQSGLVYVLVQNPATVQAYWHLIDYYVDRSVATQTLVLKRREKIP